MPHANTRIATDAEILASVEVFVSGGDSKHPLQIAVDLLSRITTNLGISMCAMRWEEEDITSFMPLESYEVAPTPDEIVSTFRQAKSQPRGTGQWMHRAKEGN